MRYVEVELKYELPEPAPLRALLARRGAAALGTTGQVDVYYTAPHHDFLARPVVSEWLRLRTGDDGSASLNFKRWHPVGSTTPSHCDEYETSLGDPEAMRRTLAALGYAPCVRVVKRRTGWRVDGEIPVLVAVDTVEGAGTFVEFEFTGDAAGPHEALAALQSFVDGLGLSLGARVRRGYPHMLLGREH